MVRISVKKLHLDLKTDRIKALTDGVFAIAMTLLVLNLEINEPRSGHSVETLSDKIRDLWPHLVHYVESFLILAAFWMEHHLQFHFIKRTDSRLFWVNMLGLFFVTLIPFSTSLVGDYGDLYPAAIFFELNLFSAGLVYYWIWSYATHGHRLVDKDLDAGIIKFYKLCNCAIPIVSILAMILTFFTPRGGTLVYLVLPVFFLFFRRS